MAKIVAVERHLGAPPEQVFDAWLNPEQAGRWLFRTPDGALDRCEIDARIGGRFRIDERRGADIAEHHGEYVELDRPRRIAFDFWTSFSDERTRVSVTSAPDDDGARLTLTHEGVWDDYEDRTRQGWTMMLDALARALAEAGSA
jgi:uncharacterized protein YndB with AHSA1/START domain